MPKATKRRTGGRAVRERKNLRLDQSLLDAARRALGADTETDAVTIALQRVVNNGRVAAGLRALGGSEVLDASRVDDASGGD